MKFTHFAIAKTVMQLVECDARRATTYLDATTVVRATRRHKPDKRSNHIEILLTLTKPNFREREFIAMCRKSGEPLPVRRVQLKYWNAKARK